jgi:hypothetical protein
MEKLLLFRDYQETQSSDFNDLQAFARQSFDDLVNDAVTGSLRYSGFNTVQSNVAEITIAPGRFYGPNVAGEIGAVYTLPTITVMSLVPYLAVNVTATRFLTLTVYGVENDTDIETRDFIINTQTLQTSPQAVPMQSSRDAVLAIVAGAEGPAPTPPPIPVNQVAVASILISQTGIVSVTMLPAGLVTSTEGLGVRVSDVEAFEAQVGPRISALASDIAALQLAISGLSNPNVLIELMGDVALLKSQAGIPATHAQYGADYLLYADVGFSDVNNVQSLGFNCKLEYGIRFPDYAASEFALTMFNTLDPNATYNSGTGMLLPTYTTVLKLRTGTYATSTAIGQYGYQTFVQEELDIPYYRIRYGGEYYVCSNGASGWVESATGTPAYWLPNFSEYAVAAPGQNFDLNHAVSWTDYLLIDSWTEPYWTLESVQNSINGALIGQSWLVSSDVWITQVGIYLATIASVTDVTLSVVQCTAGQPDLSKVIATGVLAGATLTVGMNYLLIPPTFAQKGMRLCLIVTSLANHQLGLAQAGSYLDGTFFYSLDGAYFLGDFTKEMVLEIWGAEFQTAQTTIEFGALSLPAGIRAIDLTARITIPDSCQLIFEVMPDGTGTWLPVSIDPTNPIAPFPTAPVLARFRGRFVGSPDIMPGIVLPDSIMKLSAPATVFREVTQPIQLAAPTASFSVRMRLENFNATAHSISAGTGLGTGSVLLLWGSPLGAAVAPNTLSIELIDAPSQTYDATATWSGISPASNGFVIVINGTTNSNTEVFLISQLTWWAL